MSAANIGGGTGAVIAVGMGIGISGRTMGGSRTMGRDIAEPVGEMKSAGAMDERLLISTLGV